MRMKSIAVVIVAALALSACGLFQPNEPTPAPEVNVNVTQTVIVGTPLPDNPQASPSPAPPTGDDKKIVRITVTESGGDGSRTYAVGERFTLTLTPRNVKGEDPCEVFETLEACGAYADGDASWEGLDGVESDESGIVQALGVWSTNRYNYDFKAVKAGTFKVKGIFQGRLSAEFVGTVR